MKGVCFAIVLACLLAGPALGDWKPGDPYKMHFPQLPDATGWDVMATQPKVLADDWVCTGTGPVSDIHFWGSWQGDQVGQIMNAHLSIHSNVAVGPNGYSVPGPVLWSWDVDPTLIANEPASPQGWYDPNTGYWQKPNHNLWFQYNIVNIPNAFVQQQGQVYWLDIQMTTVNGVWGWKTADVNQYPAPYTGQHFMDDAVWADMVNGQLTSPWTHLLDPVSQQSLDLAFVITPEPVTFALLTIGGVAILRKRR